MLTVKNAEGYLKHKIGDETNDKKNVWEAFKAFSTEEVEGEEEKEILFQCGVYKFTGEKLFHFDFIRSLLFVRKMTILIWNSYTVNFYLNQ